MTGTWQKFSLCSKQVNVKIQIIIDQYIISLINRIQGI